jgi:cellulose synthase/poly-beta-1,6-N-acetylglucosamine synthase-like glycosyltransferase
MISIVITSFNEPNTGKAIGAFINQRIPDKYELIVASPDSQTQDIVKEYIRLFNDPGKGKSYAINLLLPSLKGDFIILSDGDVCVSENSVSEILDVFKDEKVGCVSGFPVSIEDKNNLFGYWSHILCNSAHRWRKKRNLKNAFLECSGYLWAFRNKVIKNFPLDVGEDTIVPIMFFLKRYKVKYAQNAKVYVKYPITLRDFLKQKRRTAGAHDNIHKYVSLKKIPRMKTLFNEVLDGYTLFFYPKNFKQFFYTFLLFPFRLYIWMNLLFNSYVRKKKYSDAWKRIEGTK